MVPVPARLPDEIEPDIFTTLLAFAVTVPNEDEPLKLTVPPVTKKSVRVVEELKFIVDFSGDVPTMDVTTSADTAVLYVCVWVFEFLSKKRVDFKHSL